MTVTFMVRVSHRPPLPCHVQQGEGVGVLGRENWEVTRGKWGVVELDTCELYLYYDRKI